MRWFFLTICLIFLAGCVAYPTQRAYFKPLPQDGYYLVKSRSCGYHKTEFDGLATDQASFHLDVFPNEPDEQHLVVTIVLKPGNEAASSLTGLPILGQVRLVAGNTKQEYSASSTALIQQYQQTQWYRVEFEVMPTTQFSIEIETQSAAPLQFDFRYAKESDFYYASINC
ncbi:hypothetical protein [Vibrio methylphosphonaticus]|uniref:hypothetical protein n=1 Tax=Vibrio methylphosphonaticus TaxID=2946866 RepID=UPI00202A9104|nr:hypothetical protein [Vibrio methylphosphonaticus]MCL9774460.1 hypothetical protein [Vibrio methylphosphonaticus]